MFMPLLFCLGQHAVLEAIWTTHISFRSRTESGDAFVGPTGIVGTLQDTGPRRKEPCGTEGDTSQRCVMLCREWHKWRIPQHVCGEGQICPQRARD